MIMWAPQLKFELVVATPRSRLCQVITAFQKRVLFRTEQLLMLLLGIFFFFLSLQPNSVVGRLVDEVSRSHTITYTTLGRAPLNEVPVHHRGRYLHNTQQTQGTNIHAPSGIRTRDPSNPPVPDLFLRPHGDRDRHGNFIRYILRVK